jgi:hypothetical protein
VVWHQSQQVQLLELLLAHHLQALVQSQAQSQAQAQLVLL